MSTIEESVDVRVPIGMAYDQWTRFEEFPQFMEGVVMLQLEFTPDGIVEQAGDKLGLVKRRATGDLGRFKEFIEARGVATGAWRGEVERPQD
jgi:hypothetical protein